MSHLQASVETVPLYSVSVLIRCLVRNRVIFSTIIQTESLPIPAAISQGETLEEAKANLLDALKLVLECKREPAEKSLSPGAMRRTIDLAEA